MTVNWPAAVFDDDQYPYVLADSRDLDAWAEAEETAEFTAGFDRDARPLRLVFTDGEPSLAVVGGQDLEAFRSLTSTVLARFGAPAPVDGLEAEELIGLLRAVS